MEAYSRALWKLAKRGGSKRTHLYDEKNNHHLLLRARAQPALC